jgi:hypothetical protein
VPLNATNFYPKGPVTSSDMRQFYDMFTGVMTDQPATFRNVLSIGGNQGVTTVPLKVYGAVGQNTNLVDLYTDRAAPQPGFGFGALGNFAWGPGGASPQDTFLSRIAMQNGHVSDTAGLYINPGLEVEGPSIFDSTLQVKGALTAQTLTVGAGGAGTLSVTRINFNVNAFLQAYATDPTFVETPKLRVNGATNLVSTLVVGGASTFNAGVTIAAGLTVSGANNVVLGQDLTVSRNASTVGIHTMGRLIVAGYDAGWGANFGGNVISNGRFYQHGNGGAYCYDVLDFSFSSGIVANNLVQRDGNGYINASFINMTAGQGTGKPTYVVGNNGDGYLRYWPASAIGPPALRSYAFTGTIPAHNGTLQTVTIAGAGAAGIVTNNGTSLTAVIAGYYSIGAIGNGYNNVGVRIFTEGVMRAESNGTPNAPDFLAGIGCHHVGFINAGGAISFQGRSQQATWSGSFTVTFVPTTDYAG